MKHKSTITLAIVIKGTPKYVHESLNSVTPYVDEVLIGDIGIDSELLHQLKKVPNVHVVPFNQDVPYVEKIRQNLHSKAKGDYVFVLDPDEIVPEALIKHLLVHINEIEYARIPRKNIIFGHWMRYSRWWPDTQVRFFKRDAVVWPQTLHTQPTCTGQEYLVPEKEEYAIVHHNYESLDEYLSKAMRYAKTDALQREKITLRLAFQKGISEFISRYFAGKGYLDGMHGFILAFLQIWYEILVFCYYWEQKSYSVPDDHITESSYFFTQGVMETSHWIAKEQASQGFSAVRLKIKAKIYSLLKGK